MAATSSHRTRGEGSLYKTSTGTWRGAVFVNGKRRYVSGATKTETARKVSRLRVEVDQGLTTAGPNVTVGD